MTLPDEVHVDTADGRVVLQVRGNAARVTPSEARDIAVALIGAAVEVDPPVRAMQSEPGS